MDGPATDPVAEAARRFDVACQLVKPLGRRRFANNEEIGRLLGETGAPPVGRDAIGRWRNGTTPVPAWALIAVERLAGIEVALRLPTERAGDRPESSALGRAVADASFSMGGSRNRLQVWAGGLAVVLPVFLALWLGLATHSWDLRVWARVAQQAIEHVMAPPTSTSGTEVRPPARVAAVGSAPVAIVAPAEIPIVVPGPGITPILGGSGIDRDRGGSAALVAVDAGQGPPPPPGINGTSNPREAGGMTGTIRQGPGYAGGTIDGRGVRGCTGAESLTSDICGAVNQPGPPLPVPPLPAPSIPPVVQ